LARVPLPVAAIDPPAQILFTCARNAVFGFFAVLCRWHDTENSKNRDGCRPGDERRGVFLRT